MSLIFVLIIGGTIGLIAANFSKTGFSPGRTAGLGAIGAALASSFMSYAYVMNYFPWRNIVGVTTLSISVDIVGAIISIYGVKTYKQIKHARKIIK